MPEDATFSLAHYEQLCYSAQHEKAFRYLLFLLRTIERSGGSLGAIGHSEQTSNDDYRILTRIASATSVLFSSSDFNLSSDGFRLMIEVHRNLSAIFSATPFNSMDHLLPLLTENSADISEIQVNIVSIRKWLISVMRDSEHELDLNTLWSFSSEDTFLFCISVLSNETVLSEQASQRRESVLQWLSKKLAKTTDRLPLQSALLHIAWMHCSYADYEARHQLKAGINRLLRQELLDNGLEDDLSSALQVTRPVMVVVLEWFQSTHAMYRCYSGVINTLKDEYTLKAIAFQGKIDSKARELFDEVMKFDASLNDTQSLAGILLQIKMWSPQILYYPSLGMLNITLRLANLRLAPIQLFSLGHPATSHIEQIDYVLVEEDVAGDACTFSEKIILLPPSTISYYSGFPEISRPEPDIKVSPEKLRIVVVATTMKLNRRFLLTCRSIYEEVISERDVEFIFLPGRATGVNKVVLEKQIKDILPVAVVYPHTDYEYYINRLNTTDVFLTPFPFGNSNGFFDCIRQGVPGVCMDGPETMSHADVAHFQRLGMPDWLVTTTTTEYQCAAVRLILGDEERIAISRQLVKYNEISEFYGENQPCFVKAIKWIHEHHAELKNSKENIIQPDYD